MHSQLEALFRSAELSDHGCLDIDNLAKTGQGLLVKARITFDMAAKLSTRNGSNKLIGGIAVASGNRKVRALQQAALDLTDERALDKDGNEIGEETAIQALTKTIEDLKKIRKPPMWINIAEKVKPEDTPRTTQEQQEKRLLEIAQRSAAEQEEKTM